MGVCAGQFINLFLGISEPVNNVYIFQINYLLICLSRYVFTPLHLHFQLLSLEFLLCTLVFFSYYYTRLIYPRVCSSSWNFFSCKVALHVTIRLCWSSGSCFELTLTVQAVVVSRTRMQVSVCNIIIVIDYSLTQTSRKKQIYVEQFSFP
jgi:hypothetical protein